MICECETLVPSAILDSLADGVFTIDERSQITSFNRAAEEITGVRRADAVGRPCYEIFRASLCAGDCPLRKTCATGQAIVNRPIQITRSDGKRIPVSVSTAVLRDEDGNVIGGVETFRDLSGHQQFREELREKYSFSGIIGCSRPMRQLFAILPQFAESSSTILIDGDSGTGKELVARAVHELSSRRTENFIAVNCGALPDTLLESELFGYKAGAFTDARGDKPGRFALAAGGTIFLDEIGDISPAMQIKLLRVLQERVFEPLGSVDSVKVDVRVIAATNRNLGELVRQGTFRQDLYYRINVVRLQLPPLCDRREDIPLLVEHFLDKFNRSQEKHILAVSDEVMATLMAHDYPGNIRELENVIEYAFVVCRGGMIEPQHLPPALHGQGGPNGACRHEGLTLRELERIHIRDALRRCDGNRTAAARQLGINPSTLFRKLKSLKTTDG